MNRMSHLIGMLRSPRWTLAAAIARPRSANLAALILLICSVCSSAFLMTRVGRLAALDQRVRQLESVGAVVNEPLYSAVRSWQRYRVVVSAATILVGWPLAWVGLAALIRAIFGPAGWTAGSGTPSPLTGPPTFNQVFTVLVHASSVLALRAVVALPINYARESIGGATSLAMIVPGLGDGTFAARLLGAIDFFVLWWVALVAIGLGMLYQRRSLPIARWLFGMYAAGAAALAVTQALRGGI